MTHFQYSPAIIENYPHITGGVIFAQNISNPPTSDALREQFIAEQATVKARIGDTPLSEIESLSAWRRAFSAFGVSPTRYRNAAEALLRRLTKKGDIPSINTLVDIGNLVSIRYGLPLSVIDTAEVEGAITVHYADGTERYVELNSDEVLHPEVGEVVFSDEQKTVLARRWCWRQSASSAANANTTEIVVTIEAQHEGAAKEMQQAVADFCDLLATYTGGTSTSAILSKDNPAF